MMGILWAEIERAESLREARLESEEDERDGRGEEDE